MQNADIEKLVGFSEKELSDFIIKISSLCEGKNTNLCVVGLAHVLAFIAYVVSNETVSAEEKENFAENISFKFLDVFFGHFNDLHEKKIKLLESKLCH